MIDPREKYTTNDGREVTIALISNGIVYGYIGSHSLDGMHSIFESQKWREDNGEPIFDFSIENIPEIFVDTAIWIVPKTKQLSVTISVDSTGKCYLRGAETFGEDFARFTVNVEVEEGSFDEVYYLKPKKDED